MAKTYVHLGTGERALIETQLKLGWRPGAIAVGLNRARSTITQEIRRNGWCSPAELAARGSRRIAGGYRCVLAERRAGVLAHKPRVEAKLVVGNPLWVTVVEHLRQGLSPCQISGTLSRMPAGAAIVCDHLHRSVRHAPWPAAFQSVVSDAAPASGAQAIGRAI